MRARVIAIESGVGYVDKKKRVIIRIDDADQFARDIRIQEDKLPCHNLHLDQEIEVKMSIA